LRFVSREGGGGRVSRRTAHERLLLQDAEALGQLGSWELSSGAEHARWSPGLCRVAGVAEGFTPTLEQFISMVHPEDRSRVLREIHDVLGGHAGESEYRLVRGSGEVRHVRSRRHVRLDSRSRLTQVFGSVQDITAERVADAEIQRERNLASLVLGCMSEGFLLTHAGRIVQVNHALCRMTGFAPHALIGAATPHPFWAPEGATDIEVALRRVERGELREFAGALMHRDGSRLAVNFTCAPTRGPGGVSALASFVRDLTSQRRLSAEVERLSSQDTLTGLLNRRAFQERLQAETARARRHGRPLSLAILDLDQFRLINDRHGYPTGDRVLREAARRLRTLVREGEHLARVGGEEFGWVLPDAEGLGAIAAAERARNAIGKQPFPGVGFTTLSAGVCELQEAGDAEGLLRRAGQALGWAKQHGRDRSFRWSSDTAAELLGELPGELPPEPS
jgi:diguanylate cyclase (GGDEF)-like protein/PAS domain S-box-containing protein